MAGLPSTSGITGAASGLAALAASAQAQQRTPKKTIEGLGGDYNRLFLQLNEFQWRGISFPVYGCEVELRHDLAKHLYPDRDSGHIEPTGRQPLGFSANIPFLNYIRPAGSEHWKAGTLYPFVFRQFFNACADRSAGTLQHPEFGKVNVNPESCRVVWEADRRDGVVVTASWVESSEDPNRSDLVIHRASPITTALGAGRDLDAQSPTIKGIPPAPTGEVPFSFADGMRSIQAVSDQVSLFRGSVVGQLNQFIYRTDALTQSLDKAAEPQNWLVRQSIERLKAASLALKGNLVKQDKAVAYFTMPVDGTIGLASAFTGSTVKNVLFLNPALAATGLVPSGTIVRYYKAA